MRIVRRFTRLAVIAGSEADVNNPDKAVPLPDCFTRQFAVGSLRAPAMTMPIRIIPVGILQVEAKHYNKCIQYCKVELHNAQQWVREGLPDICSSLPFPLPGIGNDNGNEFINQTLLPGVMPGHITFTTRSRPCGKMTVVKGGYKIRYFGI
jgi:hypothetical protein